MTELSLTDRVATACSGQGFKLRELRRKLHQHPEIGLSLPTTQQTILDFLASLDGLEIATGEGLSSVTAVLRGGREPASGEKPTILLRGDMDALPVQEATGLPYASRNAGAMHACGHDLHIAGVCGAAAALCALRAELAIDVVFMFQPGEEGYDGAKLMIEEGVLTAADNPVDAAYGLHVTANELPHGQFALKSGAIMAASDLVSITVHGRGGHGSTPHKTQDPIPPASEIVLALQTAVTRGFSVFDPVVITVGSIHGGTASNVIPDEVELALSVRSFSASARESVLQRIGEIASGVCAAHGMTAMVVVSEHSYPVTVNDPEAIDRAHDVLTPLFGTDRVFTLPDPLPGSEDFSYVLNEVPGAFLFLGATPAGIDPATAPSNHSSLAEFDDSVLADAATALASLAVSHNAPTTH